MVLGGARSGKTAAAERLALQTGAPVIYLATAVPRDAEFRTRVAAHRARRPPTWTTIEEPLLLAQVIRTHPRRTIVVDCLGMFVSNLLLDRTGETLAPQAQDHPGAAAAGILAEVEDLAQAAGTHDGLVVVVSNEVGQGVVPPYPLGRAFRDTLGLANQIVARRARQVLYTIAGIAIDLKAISVFPAEEGSGGG